MSIAKNLEIIQDEIENIKKDIGRQEDTIELLAVSKTKPLEYLLEAYESGQRLFGENRINEAEIKVPGLPNDAIFHMIGHVQSNKAKKVCELFDCVQSIDSLKIAKKIDKYSKELDKVMDIYIEINTANDSNKSGFILDDNFQEIVQEIVNMSNVKIVGLMCIGAHVSDVLEIKRSFIRLKDLSSKLITDIPGFTGDKLSMGMSNDYPIAIESGSTMIRVGSSIFGSRI